MAGLSYVLASPEQEAQGLNIFPRQSDTVLFEDEVLEVEAVERQPPPKFFMSLLPRLTAATLWTQEKEVDVLPPPPWQLDERPLHPPHLSSLQQPQLKGWEQSMVQVWSGLGKVPLRVEEQGDRFRPWRRCVGRGSRGREERGWLSGC